jgi:hypothetical protein
VNHPSGGLTLNSNEFHVAYEQSYHSYVQMLMRTCRNQTSCDDPFSAEYAKQSGHEVPNCRVPVITVRFLT